MALFKCIDNANSFVVTHESESLEIPWTVDKGVAHLAMIWNDEVSVIEPSAEMSRWFSVQLDMDCRLVFMSSDTERCIDPDYAHGRTALTDGFPYLIANQASLDDLNNRLATPVPMDRFRPNVVVDDWLPFAEDDTKFIKTDNLIFEFVKPCSRCVVTTTDQSTGERGKEPLKTLASYRTLNNHVHFGVNAIAQGDVVVQVGERLTVG